MNIIKLKIVGTRPLIMHADTLADPLNPQTKRHKALTDKKKKSYDDYETIAKSEWLGGLYIDEQGPYLPGANIHAALVDGGKLSKLGAQIKRSVDTLHDRYHLEYDGPRTAEELWNAEFFDARTVKNPGSRARLVRYRPMFRKWAVSVDLAFDPESINRDQVIRCLSDAGQYCGLGDYRPKFGRFEVSA